MGLTIAVIAAVLVSLAFLLYKLHQRGAVTRSLAAINALPVEVARRDALALLREGRRFMCVTQRHSEYPGLEQIPAMLKEILAEYESIESLNPTSTMLSRTLLGNSSYHPGYLRVGIGMEASDLEFELAVLPNDERIFELTGSGAPDPGFTYTTVFHWIIATARER